MQKEGRLRTVFSFKQQVMIDYLSHTRLSARVRVETPAVLLPFLYCFTDILVVTNFYALPFFQPNLTSWRTLE